MARSDLVESELILLITVSDARCLPLGDDGFRAGLTPNFSYFRSVSQAPQVNQLVNSGVRLPGWQRPSEGPLERPLTSRKCGRVVGSSAFMAWPQIRFDLLGGI